MGIPPHVARGTPFLLEDHSPTPKRRNSPNLDKIRQAWYTMGFNKNGYITRQEFSTRGKYKIERILSQPSYSPQDGYGYPTQTIPP